MTVANCHRGVAFRQVTHAFKMRIEVGTSVPISLVNQSTLLARRPNDHVPCVLAYTGPFNQAIPSFAARRVREDK